MAEAPRILDLLLDDDDEHVIVNGDWAMAADKPAIKQIIKIRLRFFAEEWFIDLEEGLPYWTRIYIKNPSLVEVREIYRRALAESPGVSEVVSLSVGYTAPREVTIPWQVRTDTGLLITGSTESPGV